jgi:hypothetical protein
VRGRVRGGFGLTRAHARAGLLRCAEVAAVDQPAYGVGERVAQWAWGEAELAASVRVVVAGGARCGTGCHSLILRGGKLEREPDHGALLAHYP